MLMINLVLSEQSMNEKPLMYLFCIHLVAFLFCALTAVFYDPESFFDLFSFFYQIDGAFAAYLGIVCGFVGNGAFYYLLRYADSLVVSVVINFEPISGTFFAWVFGLQSEMNIYTWIGGGIVIAGNLIVTISSNLKNTPIKETSTTEENKT